MSCAGALTVTLGGNIGLAAVGLGHLLTHFRSRTQSPLGCRTKDIYIVTMYYTSVPPLLVVLLAAVSDVLAEVASLGTCPDVRGGYYTSIWVYCLLSFVASGKNESSNAQI